MVPDLVRDIEGWGQLKNILSFYLQLSGSHMRSSHLVTHAMGSVEGGSRCAGI